jgi:hypothetical protein
MKILSADVWHKIRYNFAKRIYQPTHITIKIDRSRAPAKENDQVFELTKHQQFIYFMFVTFQCTQSITFHQGRRRIREDDSVQRTSSNFIPVPVAGGLEP